MKSQALSQAEVAAATASGQLRRPDELRRIVGTIARSARGRVIITDGRGVLVADSDGAAQLGVSYASRPEIAAALRRRTVQDTRRSDTLDAEILATAVPVLSAGRVEGAVRVTQSVAAVRRATRRSILGLVAVGGLVLLLGLGAGALIARQIARPLGGSRPPPRGSATATSRRACRSRAPPSSKASRARSTRWARGSSGSSRASASSSPTPRTSSARRWRGCSCGSRRRRRPATRRRSRPR